MATQQSEFSYNLAFKKLPAFADPEKKKKAYLHSKAYQSPPMEVVSS
jgi:hypothetical protein